MRKSLIACFTVIMIAVLAACSDGEAYRIGVSQCSEGNWRYKLNNEMLAAQHLYEQDVRIDIVNCHDQSDVQVHQIDSMAQSGVDLLVVAPNEYAEVAPALKRAKERGIPVILFDRKADTDDYTAFIGGDNVAVGRLAAQYAAQLAAQSENRNVLEVTALQSTSPSSDRHKGFEMGIRQYPDVNYQCIFSDWDDHRTDTIVRQALQSERRPDVIFCHSDFMARGASWAVSAAGLEQQVKIIGVDGLPGPGEGIEGVEQGWLSATCVYPTHGEQIVRLALDILQGKPYKRENYLQSMMVTPENVETVALFTGELKKQYEDLVTVQDKLDEYFGLYNVQSKVIWASVAVIALLIVAVLLTWRGVVQIRAAHRRQKALNKEQTLFYTNASHQLKTPLTLIAGPVKELLDSKVLKDDKQQLLEIISRNVSQLESLISNVLNFRREMAQMVSDETADTAMQQATATEVLQESRVSMMKQDDSKELSTIMIIDDNDDMRRYLRTLLADKFYVLEAADGQSGLKLARESVPDLVVSDVMMPVMDGLQLCKQMKEDPITSHIPVILLTARSTDTQQMEGFEHGADAYLTKPFNADLLIVRIYNLLKSRQQLRSLFDGNKEEQPVKLSTQDKLFIDTVKEAIKANMSNADLRMDDLGEEIGLSRVQMYRKVKALTGLSPVELLREMRLQRGYALLSGTTKTVAEVAYEVGFSKPGYFSTCFKTKYGKLPSEMRDS